MPTPGRPCSACPLRGCAEFQPVTPEDLDVIDALKQAEFDFEPGSDLIREGDDNAGLYTLLVGWAYRFKTLTDGRRQILNVLLPGDFVGLQQKMDSAASHGVRALSAVRACSFRRDAVWTLHTRTPSLSYDVTWLAAHGERLVDDNLLSVGARNAQERLAAFLLTLVVRASPFDDADPQREGIAFPLTQQHLAEAMGLSLIHTHRTLRKLHQAGLYRWSGGRLALPDPARLAAQARLRWPLQTSARPLI